MNSKRIWNFLNQRFLKKYIDNRYWTIADQHENKVSSVLSEHVVASMHELYSPDFLADEERRVPGALQFRIHSFSRYIYNVRNVWVDPDYQWVLLGGAKLFGYSFPNIRDPWDKVKPTPSLAQKLIGSSTRKVKSGILIKYSWTNYYHFLIDLLPQIALCDVHLPPDVPLIVPANYDKMGFVKDYLRLMPLKREVIVQQPRQYLQVDDLYVAKEVTLGGCIGLRNQVLNNVLKGVDLSAYPERLFVTRKPTVKRSIINSAEIERIARDNGFTVIEPGDYSWMEQLKHFAKAKVIVGVHGAGMTNIVFNDNVGLAILEILPGQRLTSEHYRNIANTVGFRYERILGEGFNAEMKFSLNPEKFQAALASLLASASFNA